MKTELLIAGLTDTGKERPENQDFHAAATGNFGTVVIVCDGMGGTGGGQLASQAAAGVIRDHFTALPDNYNIIEELGKAFRSADSEIRMIGQTDPSLQGMGTTAVVLLVKKEMAYIAHIGDSRAYLIREGKIKQLTKDHSVIQQLIDSGSITENEAVRHPDRNIITRMLGGEGKNTPDFLEPFVLYKNDTIVLCSDGLHTHLSDTQILEAVKRNGLQDACRILIKLANIGGGKDNITVQLAQVTKGKMTPVLRNRKNVKTALTYFLPLAALILSIILFGRMESADTPVQEQTAQAVHSFPEKVSFSGRSNSAETPAEKSADSNMGAKPAAEKKTEPAAAPNKTVSAPAASIMLRITKPGTNVRKNADTESAPVTVLAIGTIVYGNGESKPDAEQKEFKWFRIRLADGKEGWVRSDRFSRIK